MHVRKNESPTSPIRGCDVPENHLMIAADIAGECLHVPYREVIMWAEAGENEIHECQGNHYIGAHSALRYIIESPHMRMKPGQALAVLTARLAPWTTSHSIYREADESVIALRNSIVIDAQLNEPFGSKFTPQGRLLLPSIAVSVEERSGASD